MLLFPTINFVNNNYYNNVARNEHQIINHCPRSLIKILHQHVTIIKPPHRRLYAHFLCDRRLYPAMVIVCAAGEPAAAEVASACFDRSRGPREQPKRN
ncbi:hypothetical protein BIW11_10714 [Tropilaelaps mercedesae]|uniref:Uncharacterized protein n=1 Tax=Tropilaelaps mercedesae TaxID=418985 RepID=A0A1V9XEP4_9ACAR|nr:hypothetical protein BIW11_10714 [Tropilaelaps mercedesae]